MKGRLMHGWFAHFRRRIKHEFRLDISPDKSVGPDIYPLAYCCLKLKRIPMKPRDVRTTAGFDEELDTYVSKWQLLRDAIEAGDDLFPYSSKRVADWKFNDFLFHSCGISHLHLARSTKGGTGSTLVFGIFTPGNFHALALGDHHDLYQRSRILERIGSGADELGLSLKRADGKVAWPADGKDFKQWANHKQLGGNLLYPAQLSVDGRGMLLDGHQRGALIRLTLNGVTHTVPVSAYHAYEREGNALDAIEAELTARHGRMDFKLCIDDERSMYVISWGSDSIVEYPMPHDGLTCSHFAHREGCSQFAAD